MDLKLEQNYVSPFGCYQQNDTDAGKDWEKRPSNTLTEQALLKHHIPTDNDRMQHVSP